MFFLRLRRILVGNCCCRFCVTGTVRIHKIPKTFLVKSKDRISLTESYAKRIIRTTKYTCTQLKIPNPRADCIDKNTKSETTFRSIFKGKNVHVYAKQKKSQQNNVWGGSSAKMRTILHFAQGCLMRQTPQNEPLSQSKRDGRHVTGADSLPVQIRGCICGCLDTKCLQNGG